MHAPKRVVLYARYSTDQQNPASIETQVDLGKDFVLRQGWYLADTFVDAGVSGSSFETRPGLQAALAKSNAGAYDVFLCLTLDRLSRDLEHSARILKILQFHDVELWTVHGGAAVSSMELGLRAVLSQEVLEQVRYRTREGMKTVAKHGRVPGGICYGYRIRREFDENGEPVRGLRSIDADEAATIIWIFERYAEGLKSGKNCRRAQCTRGAWSARPTMAGYRNPRSS
ncbi:DNA invertase Pin-like site-specific DNA recombinase [Neorhizobium alkalisoli]|uniref:DNA invertase Pin-like site-specific DNA recombinase n=1 Tax=Neorhizobium alkalisoli TaxID=528178 RepID=A0A561QB71_9HYPH|nr:DNA invertase Pin-like site-specific DNA recombinase [Neorhizobium alkalisoli]